ncbi:MAG TPA: DUF502 domain-containing protein [Candidatus Omnitrophota bacterium]|nr:DUF502 domain-containing protein [Candidatus Omnitrophota bacterium]HRZ14537.1 DUF502 domain-containing protein [Candidatus Omnitrophota bacterium]
MPDKNRLHNFRHYVMTGLFLVAPVSLTLFIIFKLFLFIDNILGKFLNRYFLEHAGFSVPGLGFILFFLIIFLIGYVFSTYLRRHRFFDQVEKWFSTLPLIKTIYPLLKQIVGFVSEQKELGFKKVVLVEYPARGLWSIGFLTNEQFDALNRAVSADLVSVYVPTVPGPLTGNLVFVPRQEVKVTDIQVSDALKIIISGGVVNPLSLSTK